MRAKPADTAAQAHIGSGLRVDEEEQSGDAAQPRAPRYRNARIQRFQERHASRARSRSRVACYQRLISSSSLLTFAQRMGRMWSPTTENAVVASFA
jgi:hypothetical protein